MTTVTVQGAWAEARKVSIGINMLEREEPPARSTAALIPSQMGRHRPRNGPKPGRRKCFTAALARWGLPTVEIILPQPVGKVKELIVINGLLLGFWRTPGDEIGVLEAWFAIEERLAVFGQNPSTGCA